LSRGCKRILRIWAVANENYWIAARDGRYARAMDEAGVGVLPSITIESLPPQTATRDRANFDARARYVAGQLVDKLSGVDALMASTDADFYATALACRLCGKQPGKDILITGYNDTWASSWEREFEPAIPEATIEKHNGSVGRQMMQLLLSRLDGKLPPEPQLIISGTELVVPAAVS